MQKVSIDQFAMSHGIISGMSGHSKWSTIKRQKGATDAKRGLTFTKIANVITLAARAGGSGDPEMNPRLRVAVEQARSVNMPKDNVQRAIDRGLGKLPGQSIEEVAYEGFGPGQVAFYVEGLTDNRLRTNAEVKNIFDRAGGNLGSTAYMFDKKGEIRVASKGGQKDDELLELIDLGAEDVEDYEEDGASKYVIYVPVPELNTMGTKITQSGFQLESSEIIMKPNMMTEVGSEEVAEKVISLIEKLEDHDDIQKVFTNLQ